MKIDLILPPGRHSWNLDEGWEQTLREMGLLREVKQASPKNADEILQWATRSDANLMILMGGDHHLYFLHDDARKRKLWEGVRPATVCFCYESILNSKFPDSEKKSGSATEAFSHFVYCDELDEAFFQRRGVPAIWLPQCVDHRRFHPPAGGKPRAPLVFFRGKLDQQFGYEQRRRTLEFLKKEQLLATCENEISTSQLMDEYRKHALAINLAGNFGGYNVRTFEALASGCVLFQFLPENRPKNNKLFEHGKHLLNFSGDGLEKLAGMIREIQKHPEQGARIADAGRAECLANHTIERRIQQITEFVTEAFRTGNRLHIGCGDNILPRFKNVDCRSLSPFVMIDDAGTLATIPNDSHEVIYACHVLEHFSYHKVEEVLRNWTSKLKHGGRIYLSVPNFRYLAWKYLWKGKIDQVLPPLLGGQEYPENFHYVVFDRKSLTRVMNKAGLADVATFKAREIPFTRHDCSRWPLSLNLVGTRP
jgi:predicted SAM-dependent methyltransferase